MMMRPAEAFPPGEFLREELEARGWTQAAFADILGRPARLVSDIIQAKRAITPETARRLGAALDMDPQYWLNLESSYQLWRSKGGDEDSVSRRARLYGLAPIKEMLRRGWIEPSDSIDVLERRVLDFFEAESLEEIEQRQIPHTTRKSTSYSAETLAQRAWLQRARRLTRAVPAAPYSPEKLYEALARLKLFLHVPQEIRHVPRVLSDAGIRIVIIEALPGTKIDGACFWLDDQPVIALSLRFDRIDWFWFTLMHELGHVSRRDGDSLETDMQAQRSEEEKPQAEVEADRFAGESLIPRRQVDSFVARIRPLYSARRIEAFAQTNHVHPGIVVGQLQHRGEINWSSFRQMLIPMRTFLIDTALTDGWDSQLPAEL